MLVEQRLWWFGVSTKVHEKKHSKKKNRVGSIFIERIKTKKANIVVGCIYKYPNMDALEFNNHLNQMLEVSSWRFQY